MTLTLDYRPKTFKEVVGQNHIVPVLRAFINKGNPPPVIMLAGQTASGKTSCARIYAAALNCPNVDMGNPCGECETCVSIQTGSSASVIEIDAASHGRVEDMRSIREMCMYAHALDWRVVIIDEAQSMSRDAFRALLKIMEEPPTKTAFFILTTEPDSIPRPVQSRAIPFEFRAVPLVDVAKRLQVIAKDIGFKAEPLMLARIAQTTGGHLRDAVMELEKCVQNDTLTDEDYKKFTQRVDVSTDILAFAAYNDLKSALDKVDYFFSVTSDLRKFLDLLSSSIVSVSKAFVGVPSAPGIVELAHMLNRDSLSEAYNILWNAYAQVGTSHNAKITAQLVVQSLVQCLAVHEAPQTEIIEKSTEPILYDDREVSVEEAFALLD